MSVYAKEGRELVYQATQNPAVNQQLIAKVKACQVKIEQVCDEKSLATEFTGIARFLAPNDVSVADSIQAFFFKKLYTDNVFVAATAQARITKLFTKIADGRMVSAQVKEQNTHRKEDQKLIENVRPQVEKRQDLILQYLEESVPFAQTRAFLSLGCTGELLHAYGKVRVKTMSSRGKGVWEKFYASWDNTARQTREELVLTYTEKDVDDNVGELSNEFGKKKPVTDALKGLLAAKQLPSRDALLDKIKQVETDIRSNLARLHTFFEFERWDPTTRKAPVLSGPFAPPPVSEATPPPQQRTPATWTQKLFAYFGGLWNWAAHILGRIRKALFGSR